MCNHIKNIDVKIEENVCGITAGLSFQVSFEALTRELEGGPMQDENLHAPNELIGALNREVLQEARDMLVQVKTRLLTCIVLSYTNLRNTNI